jgi:hypothetical protein
MTAAEREPASSREILKWSETLTECGIQSYLFPYETQILGSHATARSWLGNSRRYTEDVINIKATVLGKAVPVLN